MSLLLNTVILVVISTTCAEKNHAISPSNYYKTNLTALSQYSGYDEYSDCGGVLNMENGEIRYKKATSISPNERCVWVINFPLADYYEIGVSVPQPDNMKTRGLCISEIRRGQNKFTCDPEIKKDFHLFTIECKMIVVTFYSTSNVSAKDRGFSLYYRAYQNNFKKNELAMGAFMLSSSNYPPNILFYPEEKGTNYLDNALAVFVVKLPRNTYVSESSRTVMYRASIGGLYGDQKNCNDYLTIYKFSTMDKIEWNIMANTDSMVQNREMKSICPNMTEEDTPHGDLIIYVFQSDSRGNGPGFSLAVEDKGAVSDMIY